MESQKLKTLLNHISAVIYYKLWLVGKGEDVNTFIKRIQETCKIDKIVSSRFDNCIFTKDCLVDPAYRICDIHLEPHVKGLLTAPDQKYKQLLDTIAFKDNWSIEESLDLLMHLFEGCSIPFHECLGSKKHHLVFHYFCLCFLYVVCRLFGLDKRIAYREATRYARFTVIGMGDSQLKEVYFSGEGLAEYCKEHKLIFNVCLHALSDAHGQEVAVNRCFIVLRKKDEQNYTIHGTYHDDGSGFCRRLHNSPHYSHVIINRIKEALNEQADGKLRKLIERKSIQDWPNADAQSNISIRYIKQEDDFLIFKCSQTNFEKLFASSG